MRAFSARGPGRALLVSWCLLLSPLSQSVAAEEFKPLPLEEQVSIFLKALAYDRNLEAKARGDILIGILFVREDAESEETARSIAKLIAASPMQAIGDLPVFYRMIGYEDSEALSGVIEEEWIDVLYLAPGVGGILDSVLAITEESHVLTVTGVAGYVIQGVSLGVGELDGESEIIVNLDSATKEGSKFSGQFLSLCTVLRPEPQPRGRLAPR